MSKKHFIELADCLRAINPGQPVTIDGHHFTAAQRQWNRTVEALADFCARQNPMFNRERWLVYIAGECGPNGGQVK